MAFPQLYMSIKMHSPSMYFRPQTFMTEHISHEKFVQTIPLKWQKIATIDDYYFEVEVCVLVQLYSNLCFKNTVT